MEQTRTVWHMQVRGMPATAGTMQGWEGRGNVGMMARARLTMQHAHLADQGQASQHLAAAMRTLPPMQLDHQRNRVLRINLLIRCGTAGVAWRWLLCCHGAGLWAVLVGSTATSHVLACTVILAGSPPPSLSPILPQHHLSGRGHRHAARRILRNEPEQRAGGAAGGVLARGAGWRAWVVQLPCGKAPAFSAGLVRLGNCAVSGLLICSSLPCDM